MAKGTATRRCRRAPQDDEVARRLAHRDGGVAAEGASEEGTASEARGKGEDVTKPAFPVAAERKLRIKARTAALRASLRASNFGQLRLRLAARAARDEAARCCAVESRPKPEPSPKKEWGKPSPSAPSRLNPIPVRSALKPPSARRTPAAASRTPAAATPATARVGAAPPPEPPTPVSPHVRARIAPGARQAAPRELASSVAAAALRGSLSARHRAFASWRAATPQLRWAPLSSPSPTRPSLSPPRAVPLAALAAAVAAGGEGTGRRRRHRRRRLLGRAIVRGPRGARLWRRPRDGRVGACCGGGAHRSVAEAVEALRGQYACALSIAVGRRRRAPAAPAYAALMRPSPLAPPEVGLRPRAASTRAGRRWSVKQEPGQVDAAARPRAAARRRAGRRPGRSEGRRGSDPRGFARDRRQRGSSRRAPRTFGNTKTASPEKEAPDTVKQPCSWLSPAPGTAPVESYSPPASRPPRPLFSPSKAVRFKE